MSQSQYKRILLKISGESLKGSTHIDHQSCLKVCELIEMIYACGSQVAIVIGGGNIFRGSREFQRFGFDRISADHMGMMATIINGLALGQTLKQRGVKTRVMSALELEGICERYYPHNADLLLEKNVVCIFTGGTGNPFFTTDTAAALRASELKADLFLKGTQVDGVYDKDPHKFKDAQKFETLTYNAVLSENLEFMDATAVTLLRENNIPIQVSNQTDHEAIKQAICENKGGTRIQ